MYAVHIMKLLNCFLKELTKNYFVRYCDDKPEVKLPKYSSIRFGHTLVTRWSSRYNSAHKRLEHALFNRSPWLNFVKVIKWNLTCKYLTQNFPQEWYQRNTPFFTTKRSFHSAFILAGKLRSQMRRLLSRWLCSKYEDQRFYWLRAKHVI